MISLLQYYITWKKNILLNKDINSFWEDKILQIILKLYFATLFRSSELIMQKIIKSWKKEIIYEQKHKNL